MSNGDCSKSHDVSCEFQSFLEISIFALITTNDFELVFFIKGIVEIFPTWKFKVGLNIFRNKNETLLFNNPQRKWLSLEAIIDGAPLSKINPSG